MLSLWQCDNRSYWVSLDHRRRTIEIGRFTDFQNLPQPYQRNLNVEWQNKSASQTVASLIGMRGEVIRSGIRFVDGKMEIDLSELANGPYHLAFIGPAKLFVTTIIKD